MLLLFIQNELCSFLMMLSLPAPFFFFFLVSIKIPEILTFESESFWLVIGVEYLFQALVEASEISLHHSKKKKKFSGLHVSELLSSLLFLSAQPDLASGFRVRKRQNLERIPEVLVVKPGTFFLSPELFNKSPRVTYLRQSCLLYNFPWVKCGWGFPNLEELCNDQGTTDIAHCP